MGTLVLGYDVEVCDAAQSVVTRHFLTAAERVHRETETPCTMFTCGKTLELNAEAFRSLAGNPLFDFQSHTYDHSLLKSNVQWQRGEHTGNPGAGEVRVMRGASLDRIGDELARTKKLLEEVVGASNIGLRAPTGCYLGLLDRPELLDLLWSLGIRYVSTYHMHPEDFRHWKVMPLAAADIIPPFWYSQVAQSRGWSSEQGAASPAPTLPPILEFPLHGAIDCVWKDIYGYDAYGDYLNAVKSTIDVVAREDLVLSYVQHDWSSIKGDPAMACTRAIIRYAQERGLEIVTHTEHYERLVVRHGR